MREEVGNMPDLTVKAEKSPYRIGFYKLFWVFFVGSFLGVVLEVVWSFFFEWDIVSRQGLIYGPFNLVYGFGALVMLLGLLWMEKKNNWWLFLGGVIIGSIFEYSCSWVQEALFGSVSWQYDTMPLNLHGRITIVFSLMWGGLGIAWIRWLYPWISRFVDRIPKKVSVSLTWVLLLFMVGNSFISGFAVRRMAERREAKPAANEFEQFLDQHYPDEMLSKIYVNMVFVDQEKE